MIASQKFFKSFFNPCHSETRLRIGYTEQSPLKHLYHLELNSFTCETRLIIETIVWSRFRMYYDLEIILSVAHFNSLAILRLISLELSLTLFDLTWDDFFLQLTDSLISKVILLLLYWRLVHWSGSQTTNTRIEIPSLTLIIRSNWLAIPLL